MCSIHKWISYSCVHTSRFTLNYYTLNYIVVHRALYIYTYYICVICICKQYVRILRIPRGRVDSERRLTHLCASTYAAHNAWIITNIMRTRFTSLIKFIVRIDQRVRPCTQN